MKQLSDYELSCGSVQVKLSSCNKLELYKEGGVYHVRLYSRVDRVFWHTFDKLSSAKKEVQANCKRLEHLKQTI